MLFFRFEKQTNKNAADTTFNVALFLTSLLKLHCFNVSLFYVALFIVALNLTGKRRLEKRWPKAATLGFSPRVLKVSEGIQISKKRRNVAFLTLYRLHYIIIHYTLYHYTAMSAWQHAQGTRLVFETYPENVLINIFALPQP